MIEPLKLTQEHKDKLLEMCRKLFPEYKHTRIIDGSCDFCLENTLLLSTSTNPKHNDWILVHWFEFCMTALAYKIYPLLDSRWKNVEITRELVRVDASLEDDMSVFISNLFVKHPVDCLYKEFLKLKNDKKIA